MHSYEDDHQKILDRKRVGWGKKHVITLCTQRPCHLEGEFAPDTVGANRIWLQLMCWLHLQANCTSLLLLLPAELVARAQQTLFHRDTVATPSSYSKGRDELIDLVHQLAPARSSCFEG